MVESYHILSATDMGNERVYRRIPRKREMQLLLLVGSYLNLIAKTYSSTKKLIMELHCEIIALTIDWD
jgi:hypothetical protein